MFHDSFAMAIAAYSFSNCFQTFPFVKYVILPNISLLMAEESCNLLSATAGIGSMWSDMPLNKYYLWWKKIINLKTNEVH
jgi:hypothetical protein